MSDLIKEPSKKEWEASLATHKCKLALREIDVPGYVIDKFSSGRLLDYFVHLCIMERPPWPWKKALDWVWENRKDILELERKEKEQSKILCPQPTKLKDL